MPSSEHQDGGGSGRRARLLRSTMRPVAAAVLGVLLGAACQYLPESLQLPCETLSHVLPAACGEKDRK